jgi:hypothetical protein
MALLVPTDDKVTLTGAPNPIGRTSGARGAGAGGAGGVGGACGGAGCACGFETTSIGVCAGLGVCVVARGISAWRATSLAPFLPRPIFAIAVLRIVCKLSKLKSQRTSIAVLFVQ